MAKLNRRQSLKILHKIGEDFLSCAICLEQYKNPKILPCHHTFCGECLLKFTKNATVVCPTCKTPCQLSRGGVNELKSSFFISSLLDIFSQGISGHDDIHGVCEGCEGSDASHRCVDCCLDFCQSCTMIHKTVQTTRNHKVLVHSDHHEPRFANIRFDQKVYCSNHPENMVKFYCDTCQIPVCLECTVVEHRYPRCSHRKLQDAADDYIKKLREMLTELRVKEAKSRAYKSVAGDNRDKLRKYCREEKQKIKGKADEIIRMIRREQHRLVEELTEKYDAELKTAEIQVHDMEFKHGNISSVCSYIEAMISHGSATHLLSSKEEVLNRIDKLTKTETKAPKPPEIVKFKAKSSNNESGMLGLLPSKVSVPHCSVENIPRKLFTGGSVDVIIKTRDSAGKLVIPFEEVMAKVAKREGSWTDLSVFDNGDGTHRVTVHGRVEGTYRVTVTIAGQVVPGTPFDVSITTGLVTDIGKFGIVECQFSGPMGVVANRHGDLVTCDTNNNRVQIIDKDGNYKSAFTVTLFKNPVKPYCIAISAEEEYFMTDRGNNRVVVSDENGQLHRYFGQAELKYPHGIAISPLDGSVYVTDWDGKTAGTDKEKSHCVRKFTPDGQHIKSFGKYGTKRGHFRGPAYLAINGLGMAFVSDYDNNRVWMISADCEFLSSIGSGGSEDGHLRGPLGVAIDWRGYMYIAELKNGRVQKFTNNGRYVCRIDTDKDGLNSPHGITLTNDVPCRVAVVDNYNNCIKVFAQKW
ncbi:tripartite motif-containing protein 3-like [Ptychodera flava]|uniref:tripartite motif-containing protein 3-like n=1 Tax=Ptychodera flava TaxID=63121 RepID=UPI00396A30FA